jgi:hypothetical protein
MSRPREDQAAEMLSFIKPNDSVVFTEYEFFDTRQDHPKYEDLAVAFRPKPLSSAELDRIQAGAGSGTQASRILRPSVSDALREAVKLAAKKRVDAPGRGEVPIVITGSLYLVGDVLRCKHEIFT